MKVTVFLRTLKSAGEILSKKTIYGRLAIPLQAMGVPTDTSLGRSINRGGWGLVYSKAPKNILLF